METVEAGVWQSHVEGHKMSQEMMCFASLDHNASPKMPKISKNDDCFQRHTTIS
jgi:hypothetical protein